MLQREAGFRQATLFLDVCFRCTLLASVLSDNLTFSHAQACQSDQLRLYRSINANRTKLPPIAQQNPNYMQSARF